MSDQETSISPIGMTIYGHANQWYLPTLEKIIRVGDKVTTRGRTTWEVLHATTRLPDPRQRVLTIPHRRANPFFQAMETVWILAGRSDAAWITYYNSQLAQFLDTREVGPGWAVGGTKQHEHFHGAYGERLVNWGRHLKSVSEAPYRNQIQDVILQLLAEASSRRAVMAIHNPNLDNPSNPTLDRPCNMAMSYQLRHGHLFAATFNRSNDLNLGLAFTNIVQFTTIQEFIAAALSVEVGHYTHFSSSLHVYHDDPVVQRLMRPMMVVRSNEPVAEVSFDVYRMFGSTPMKKWSSPEEGWETIKVLEAVGEPNMANPNQRDLQEARSMMEAISCPYWRSVGWMAIAWHCLKKEQAIPALEIVMDYLSNMDAHDWLIACLEYMNRWAANRRLTKEFCQLLSRRFGSFERSVEDFILHDGGSDAA